MNSRFVCVAFVLLALLSVCQALTLPITTKAYFGGSFSTIKGQSVNNIGYYDLKTKLFDSLEGGANGPVQCIHVDIFGFVYAGGRFSSVGSGNASLSLTAPIAFHGLNFSATNVKNVETDSKWLSVVNNGAYMNVNAQVRTIATDYKVSSINSMLGSDLRDVYVGGDFTLYQNGESSISNLARWSYTQKKWVPLGSETVTNVNKVVKSDYAIFNSNKVYVAATFTGRSSTYFGVYDVSTDSWSFPSNGPTSTVTDIYYNVNALSTDDIFVVATTFGTSGCVGICNYNHKTGAWSVVANVQVRSGQYFNTIAYVKGFSTSMGSIFLGGSNMDDKVNVLKSAGKSDFAALGADSWPGTNTAVSALGTCGIENTFASITKCTAGSVFAATGNTLNFYDASTNKWSTVFNTSSSLDGIYTVKVYLDASASTTFTSMALILVLVVLALLI
ncbi:hypothetical protein C9374_007103 [Naegleria lovaniensis]|uniref:Uncharacterized protein n=1 Tax=Naegleria lovaniensis TaxID=51637 RepID=A0AA88H6N1_NAELO|nr:uncharacterized protein C9374_007103 [Naegleria lovaniensis]KAG2393572.1 hypothetical protein C9374_007103 [Naegleria lovaniensis]